MLLEKLLDKLYNAKAMIFKPATEEDIRLLRLTLARNKIPGLPTEYIRFLNLTDGLLWNGLRFYGVRSHERKDAGYKFPSLLEVNLDMLARERLKNVIVLGEKDEDLIVYSLKEKNYQLMDKMDLMADLNLPRFYDILYLFSDDLSAQSQESVK